MLVTRFAPSPTGYLHLGHVVNAIYVWGIARAHGGRVLLRIEDHDRIRCRPEYEAALLEDLDWLGFVPDAGRDPVERQSDHPEVYEAALRQLAQRYPVYGCDCSRKDIRLRRGEKPEVTGRGSEVAGQKSEVPWQRAGGTGRETDGRYPGTCRARELWKPNPGGFSEPPRGCGLRVRVEPGVETIDDLAAGTLRQDPSQQCGDLLIRDRDGHWTYQFAVAVDDVRQGVTLVIRGRDLITSTGRQVRLARMLGRDTVPTFLHHPLIMRASGEKLSKAAGDTGIRELRRAGLTPEQVIGRAAAAVGLVADEKPIAAADVLRLFTQ